MKRQVWLLGGEFTAEGARVGTGRKNISMSVTVSPVLDVGGQRKGWREMVGLGDGFLLSLILSVYYFTDALRLNTMAKATYRTVCLNVDCVT